MDASKAFKKSRTTIYEAIKNGELSRDNDGFLDLSELIRVYGNPISVQSSTRTKHYNKDVQVHVQSEVETVLKDQISLLKNQLDLAHQREKSLMQHIENLTHRIEFKGQFKQQKTEIEESKKNHSEVIDKIRSEQNDDEQTNLDQKENKQVSVPEHSKKGWLSRIFS